ncbi:hypothetical protein ACTGWL_05275 [Streptococcus suis]
MSDLSIAKGLVTISMANKKALVDFAILAKKAWEVPYYSTTLDMATCSGYSTEHLLTGAALRGKIEEELVEYNERTALFQITLAFTGLGEYTYENTIKRVFSSIHHFVGLRGRDFLFGILHSLEQEKITLSFDFNDMVETSNHLSKNRIVVVKPAGQSLQEDFLDYVHHSEIMMEYTARNLKNVMDFECFGTEPEFIHSLVDGLIHVCEEDKLPVEEYQALIELRQLHEKGELTLALREDISQEIANVSGDSEIVILDKEDLDPLRNTDLREVISDYWEAITRLEKVAV